MSRYSAKGLFTGLSKVSPSSMLLAALAMPVLLLPGGASADNLGVTGKLSTLGYGVDVDYVLTDHFSVRGQINQFSYDDTFTESDIDYDGTLDLSTFGALVDWHPFGGSFRVSAGGFNVDNKLKGIGSGTGTYEIGDGSYTVTPGDDLKINAKMELGNGFKPYLGVGWGHAPTNKGGLLLSFDVGILFQGSPNVDLKGTGTATDDSTGFTVDFSSDPTVQDEIRKEEQRLEDDLNDFDLYPVLSFGIGWRF